MATEKQFNSRMQQKIDTTANWGKATNFVPKKGEIIVYSDGGGIGVPKIKVGDGATVVGSLKFLVDGNITWGANQNAIFPAGITATSFNGSASKVANALTLNGVSYDGSAKVSLSSQQLGVPSAFIAKSVSVLDCNNEKIGRVLSSSAANSLVNGPTEIGSTGAGVLWNIPALSAPTSSINEAGTQQKLYQIFVYDSGKVYLRKNSSNDTATWTYGTWEKLLTDVNITAENIKSALGYTPVKDVQVAGSSVLDGGVAKVPIASATRPGVIRVGSANNSGMYIDEKDGNCYISYATKPEIDGRTAQRKTIVCSNFDYAVKVAMCDGKGAAWTSAEQKAARDRMGIDKPYELIEEFDLSEASTFERTEEPDGTPYAFIDIITQIIVNTNISLTQGEFLAQAKNIAGNFVNVGRGYMANRSSVNNRMGYMQRTRIRHGYWESEWCDWQTNLSVMNFNSANVYLYWLKYKESEYKAINKIYETTVLPAGTHIRIFGVRAQ